MNLRRVDLNLLTVFHAVMTERNMTRAAEKIGMTQPAMSLAISRFKHLVGDELFERTGRGVRPTPRALALAGPVGRALGMVRDALEQDADFDIRSSERSFNIALGDLGELLLVPPLMRLLQANDSLIVISTLDDQGVDAVRVLRHGSLDLYLWITPEQDSSIACEQVGTLGEVCLVRKGHPLIKDSITAEQYAGLNHVVFRLPGDYGASLVDRELWKLGLERRHAMTVHSYFDMPAVIACTDMVCSVPRPVGEKFATLHDLQCLPAPVGSSLPIFLMWPRNAESDEGHRWLRHTTAELIRALADR